MEEGNVATEASVQPKRWPLRFRRKHLLLLLLIALIGVSGIWTNYLVKRRPLSSLPGVGELFKTVPPRYLFSLNGALGPLSVAISPSGDRVYVGEGQGERQIRVYDRNGTALTAFAPPDSTPGTRMPMGMAVAKSGRLYVADRLRGAIDMYAPDGSYRGRFAPQTLTSWLPLGVALDDEDTLYVTDTSTGYHRVLVLRQNGALRVAMGKEGEGKGELSFPYAAAVDSQYRIFVADSNNGRVSVFSRDGSALGAFAGGSQDGAVGLPRGIAFDPQGRLHVVDAASHTINVYDMTSNPPQFLFRFGDLGIGDGEFRFPNGLAVDQTGRVYVTDRENHRVHAWSY